MRVANALVEAAMSVEQLTYKPDAPNPPTTGKAKPSAYISPKVVREIFDGKSLRVSPSKLGG
jgi:hypothetical protein